MKTIKSLVLFALMFMGMSVMAQGNSFGDDVYFSSKNKPAEPQKVEVVKAEQINPVVVTATDRKSVV